MIVYTFLNIQKMNEKFCYIKFNFSDENTRVSFNFITFRSFLSHRSAIFIHFSLDVTQRYPTLQLWTTWTPIILASSSFDGGRLTFSFALKTSDVIKHKHNNVTSSFMMWWCSPSEFCETNEWQLKRAEEIISFFIFVTRSNWKQNFQALSKHFSCICFSLEPIVFLRDI